MKKVILILGFLLITGNAQAITGNELLRVCIKSEHTYDDGFCSGFFVGFMQYHQATRTTNLMLKQNWSSYAAIYDTCIPEKVTYGQIQRVFLKYAKENPAHLHEDVFAQVMASIHEAWPCEKNN